MLNGKKRNNIVLVAFILFSLLCKAQIYNSEIQAKLDISSNGQFFEITGFATNKTEFSASLRYLLSVIIKETDSINPTDKFDLEGTLVLERGQRQVLEKFPLTVPADQRTILLLLVYDKNDKIVGQDRIVLYDDDGSDPLKEALVDKTNPMLDGTPQEEDGVFRIRGLLSEDTKTKPGRDFYKAYSDEYIRLEIKGERMVSIVETFALGSNTRISVIIENNVIFQFFLNPRSSYIEQMVDGAIARTNRYFDQLEKNRNQVIRY